MAPRTSGSGKANDPVSPESAEGACVANGIRGRAGAAGTAVSARPCGAGSGWAGASRAGSWAESRRVLGSAPPAGAGSSVSVPVDMTAWPAAISLCISSLTDDCPGMKADCELASSGAPGSSVTCCWEPGSGSPGSGCCDTGSSASVSGPSAGPVAAPGSLSLRQIGISTSSDRLLTAVISDLIRWQCGEAGDLIGHREVERAPLRRLGA